MKKIIMLICLLISFCIPVQALAADPPVINSLEGASPFGGDESFPDADEAFYPIQWQPYSLNVTTTPADATVSFEVVKMTTNDDGVLVPAPSQDHMGAAITPNNEFYFLGGEEYIYLLKITAEANGLSTTKNYYALCGDIQYAVKNVTVGESTDISIQSPMDSIVFSYSTADPSIAQASSDGILTGVSPGTTNFFVTATYQGDPYIESANVNVTPAALTPPIISVNKNNITYPINSTTSESQFLSDIGSTTDDGSTVTSDFSTAVNLNKTGDYTVTLNATNSDGSATPVQVTVHIENSSAPIISADNEITYEKASSVTGDTFLADIHASTNDGSTITSDFSTTVNLNKAGDYTVTLNSTNSADVPATPFQVTVHVKDSAPTVPVITADKEITYTRDTTKSESAFLADIHAKSSDGSKINSDFAKVVNLNRVGDYQVTLTDGSAEPVSVTVHVVKSTNNSSNSSNNSSNGPSSNPIININTGGNNTSQQKAALPSTGDSASNNLMVVLAGIALLSGSYYLLRRK